MKIFLIILGSMNLFFSGGNIAIESIQANHGRPILGVMQLFIGTFLMVMASVKE